MLDVLVHSASLVSTFTFGCAMALCTPHEPVQGSAPRSFLCFPIGSVYHSVPLSRSKLSIILLNKVYFVDKHFTSTIDLCVIAALAGCNPCRVVFFFFNSQVPARWRDSCSPHRTQKLQKIRSRFSQEKLSFLTAFRLPAVNKPVTK